MYQFRVIPLEKVTSKVQRRFWDNVSLTPDNKCWEWKGRKQSRPATPYRPNEHYGIFKVGQHPFLAHRIAFALTWNKNPSNMVLHRCDWPPCVNPAHLYEGTHADNMRDRRDRHRVATHAGETNGSAKLKTEEVIRIRSTHRRGVGGNAQALADEFGVTVGLIRQIARGALWKCVLAAGASGD